MIPKPCRLCIRKSLRLNVLIEMSNLILVDKPASLLHISSRYTGYHKYLLPGQAQIRVLTLPGMRSSASRPSDDEPKPRRSPIGGSRPIVLVACQSLILHENLIGTLPDIVTVMPAQDREWPVKGGTGESEIGVGRGMRHGSKRVGKQMTGNSF